MHEDRDRRESTFDTSLALTAMAFGTGTLLACLGAGLGSLLARIRRLHVEVEFDERHERIDRRR